MLTGKQGNRVSKKMSVDLGYKSAIDLDIYYATYTEENLIFYLSHNPVSKKFASICLSNITPAH
jgi:hypothetical protein